MSHIDNLREIEEHKGKVWTQRDKVRSRQGYLKALKQMSSDIVTKPLYEIARDVHLAIKEAEK